MRTLNHGFTLVELIVTIAVLTLLVLFVTSLVNSAATITTLGNKRMDADSQARQLLDRMAVDFAQMVKRDDVDFFAKGTIAPRSVGGAMTGNDQIAFYSAVPGYYPSTGSQSPMSLVGYRINSVSGTTAFNKMERLGKGLVWNGVSATDNPVVFLPLTIFATWPYATNANPDPASPPAYEIIGPQVFRFEYSYLLTSGSSSITPPASVSGIAAIIVDVAMIDQKSKVLLTDTQITALAGQLTDYGAGMVPGQLLGQWQSTLDANTTLPRPAVSGIRLYERYFYLSAPTL
jgi:prepilin-type N-terminal cleavage/methylation domain-containing protein